MAYSLSTATATALEEVRMKRMTVDQGNVYKVQLQGVHIVRGSIPADVRKALNTAVKNGELGHIKRNGLKPEVYHHKNARWKAIEAQNREEYKSKQKIRRILT